LRRWQKYKWKARKGNPNSKRRSKLWAVRGHDDKNWLQLALSNLQEALMSKMAIEKNNNRGSARRFISPSFKTDHKKQVSTSNMEWKNAAALVIGAWAVKHYPKTTLVGALVLGIYAGLTSRKNKKRKNPFKGTGIVRNMDKYLH
jgi:hypothetical protein